MTFAASRSQQRAASQSPFNLLRQALPGSDQLLKDLRQRLLATNNKQRLDNQSLAYERALDQGCCHGAAQVNRLKPELDWTLLSTQQRYKAYVEHASNELDRLRKAHQIDKHNLIILIEPNSFALPGTSGKRDWRQQLHALNGRKLSLRESAAITAIYDNIYRDCLANKGYTILSFPDNKLNADDFYDAVHLTTNGSFKMGRYYAETLQPRSSHNRLE